MLSDPDVSLSAAESKYYQKYEEVEEQVAKLKNEYATKHNLDPNPKKKPFKRNADSFYN